ncbi:MAG: hypothetical protein ACK5PQ_05065 [Alphaproteobacteria bacterium]
MVKHTLYILLAVVCFLNISSYAADYALYSPELDKGGQVGQDGTWEITDECAASQTFQEPA